MNDGLIEPASGAFAPAPKRKMFGNKFTMVRLPLDAIERQSRITLLAWKILGPDAARSFLNSHSGPLNGRPLDLAVASAEGFEAVQRALAKHTART